jgi:mannose-1-phosphate guanylyltransferase
MSLAAQRRHLWVVVLAAGNGKRLAAMTAENGEAVPKQYSTAIERPTLLERALARGQRLVPATHTVVIVAEEHRRFWERTLLEVPAGNIVAQPEDRGTAVGILLAFQHVLAQDANAHLLFLPSDHFVQDEPALACSLAATLEALHVDGSRLVLLGMPCERPEAEYGWIVPVRGSGRVRDVAAFREKPTLEEIEGLLEEGALLNTFMFAATGETLLRLYLRSLPSLLATFEGALGACALPLPERLRSLYSDLPTLDFSRDVLERETERLSVLRARPCGWADLGTPERLERHRQRERAPAARPRARTREYPHGPSA